MHFQDLPSSSLLLAAALSCGCGDPAVDDRNLADSGPIVAPCTPMSFSENLPMPTPFRVLDIAPLAGGAVALVAGSEVGLQLIREDLSSIALLDVEPFQATLTANDDASVCVTFAPLATGPLHRACSPEFAIEEFGGEIELDGSLHVAMSDTFGPVAFYRGGFASADAAYLQDGAWSTIELFESSISSFGDAVSHAGAVFACLLGSGSRAAIVGETNSGFGSDLDRIVTDGAEGVQGCKLSVVDGELRALYRDREGRGFLGTASFTSTGLDAASWTSAVVTSDLPGTYSFAASANEQVISYRHQETGEAMLRRERNGIWEEVSLRPGENMGDSHVVYDASGTLHIASSGLIASSVGVGFFRVCPEE